MLMYLLEGSFYPNIFLILPNISLKLTQSHYQEGTFSYPEYKSKEKRRAKESRKRSPKGYTRLIFIFQPVIGQNERFPKTGPTFSPAST